MNGYFPKEHTSDVKLRFMIITMNNFMVVFLMLPYTPEVATIILYSFLIRLLRIVVSGRHYLL